MEPVEEPPKIDQEGYVTCPDCGMRVNCGMVGISNLTKRHCGTKKCLELKARRDKKWKGMAQGSLLVFIKPKPMMVPPMVEGTSLIQSNAISTRSSNSTPLTYLTLVESKPINGRSQFVTKLEGLIRRLPANLPNTEGDELWEANLNRFLKEVLGWGTENCMDSIICQGKKGMDGVLEFTRYPLKSVA
ncbi:hypothetical protein B0H34DRAFT_784500 [Crassisporium funariophilum]|nr:hypothetical protein B0H34DRAFT_784500 [Crassisporium funariophilum]